jgi:hypothetical protein
MIAKRKSDHDVAPVAEAADPTPVSHLQLVGARSDPRSGRWSMDAVFYLAGYAAITAAVLSFFGLW